ncbi:hypothetical protein BCV69DRAFT_252881 [Microstroma glucosiphilum]|uniref:Acyl-CoA dehydrogenase NM domain-like protein n=1 Tax=Pseudomicrostroma glucosiphilum TaxID=1684307 RepID=A0A316TZE6_9BASI|nr:hypothetical protein BCV69DRAFT_252881 [Pseudomicrostroma glucosiphilum]PWN18360.1 hypothetical protein BCV69DRAFT_252881 [Pseudomicrostroma glucosiphilum]
MRAEQGHQFPPIPLHNPFRSNAPLQRLLLRLLGESPHLETIFNNLDLLADRCIGEHALSANKLKGVEDEPRLIQYDAWGRRIDELRTGEGWRELKAATAKEGIVAESYPLQKGDHSTSPSSQQQRPKGYLGRDQLGADARIYAFVKIFMFGPFSKLVLCPISMTDGAARVLELAGTPDQKRIISLLTHADPTKAWTAGQWMTERPGGSDISRTETTARPVAQRSDGNYRSGDSFLLDGFKWFSSATDGDIALALARTDADFSKGSRGLSLFLLKVRDPQTGKLNGIRVHRLKQKLGTKYLPTAELELDSCQAELVGTLGQGVKIISSVLNVTRLYSAAGGVFTLTHGLRQSASFSLTRQVGQKQLSEYPLHTQSLFRLTVLQRALQQLFFFNSGLLGKSEAQTANKRDLTLLRLYTPALKAYTAIRASESTLSLLDSFGGQGYMEDSGLGIAESLRDLAVERVWEGTIEVLGMDVVRVVMQSKGEALFVLVSDLRERLSHLMQGDNEGESDVVTLLQGGVDELERSSKILLKTFTDRNLAGSLDYRFAAPLLELMMILNGGALLLEQAGWTRKQLKSQQKASPLVPLTEDIALEEAHIARTWVMEEGELAQTLTKFKTTVEERARGGAVKDTSLDLQHRIVFTEVLDQARQAKL